MSLKCPKCDSTFPESKDGLAMWTFHRLLKQHD